MKAILKLMGWTAMVVPAMFEAMERYFFRFKRSELRALAN